MIVFSIIIMMNVIGSMLPASAPAPGRKARAGSAPAARITMRKFPVREISCRFGRSKIQNYPYGKFS
ncbi:hypothetical protein ACO2Q0_20600 [Phenylobacterium sp. VNQ135]|uniref:hypothetical protein n=1 Tax=Phenylobacterium sp. VNQ135 TaxID=3400922 RepID=UPI003C09ACF8